MHMSLLSVIGIKNKSSLRGLPFHSQWCVNKQKFLILMKSNLSILGLCLMIFLFFSQCENLCLLLGYDDTLLCFF